MKCSEEELIVLATTVAMQLANGLECEEIEDLKIFINQISCSLSSLLSYKYTNKKK